ncbi:hypothetical protein CgunFtcFv8_012011 [Champsocephalus gunnari]|uniref:Uncharacterized protein n=1 Tax=Champsocephalus gunnari TaxID=52237 RepID=A0AAN8HIZ0_CHAGU|nr:hypothetical protein CgunFtcFv8_012011 [Champsocephalus gunnari]
MDGYNRILLDGGGPLRPWSLSLCELRWLVTCLRGQKPLLQNTQHEGNSRRRAEQPDSVDDDIFKHPPPTHTLQTHPALHCRFQHLTLTRWT